jgi:hypothetical protein
MEILITGKFRNVAAEEGRDQLDRFVKEREVIIQRRRRRRRNVNWICYNLCGNCLLKHVIEGNIYGTEKVTGRRGRRSKHLLDDVKEIGEYWKLKEEELDRTVWRTGLGRVCGPVISRTAE